MRIDNPSISGSLSFIGGNNSISATSVNLTGSFSGSVVGTFEGGFSSTATTEISGAFDSVSSSLASRVADQESFSSSLDNTFATDAQVATAVSSLNAATSSFAFKDSISGSFTSLSSSLASELLKNTTDTLTGDLTVTGTLTAQDLHVQEVTSSIVFSSGSNKFGENVSNTHEFTGSLNLTGSITYGGSGLNIIGQSSDGSDNQTFFIGAGGAGSDTRGAYIWGRGNEATNGGRIQINAGNTATGDIQLYTGGSVRTYISSSGFVGIGTQTELQSKLTLYGSDKEGFITFREISNRSWQIFAKDGDFNIRDDNADSTYFFIDGGTGNVGIGTTSPDGIFKAVLGSAPNASQILIGYNSTSENYFDANTQIFRNGSYAEKMRLDVQGNLQLATTAFSGSGDPRLFVGSKGNYYHGSGTGLGDFHIGDGNYGLSFGAAIGGGGAGDMRIWTTGGTHNLRIGTNSNDHLTLNSDGYLGVGTSSPDAKLHIRHTSTYPGLIVQADAGNEQIVIKRYSNANEQLILGFHSSDYGRIQAVEQGVGYRPLALNQNGGSVGIGTISPVSRFEVRESLNSTNFTGITVTNSEGGNTNLSRAGIAFKAYDWVQSAIWHGRNMSDGNQGALVLGTNPDTTDLTVGGVVGRMWIVNNGNVGVGTADPTAKLHLYVNSANDDTFHIFNGSVRTHLLASESSNGVIYMRSSNNSNTVRLNASGFSYFNGGNVGIGVTSPDKKLEIKISDNTDGVYFAQTIGGSRASAGYSVGIGIDPEGYGNRNKVGIVVQGHPSGWSAGKMHFLNRLDIGTNGEADLTHSRMTVDYTGNIGIGSQTPSTILDVSGGSVSRIRINSSSNNAGILFAEAGTNTWSIASVSSGDLQFFREDGTGNKMRLTSAGKLGIGTTNPNATLHVNGGAHFGPDSGVLNPSTGEVLIETAGGGTPALKMYPYGASVFEVKSDGTTATIGWGSGADREVNILNTGAGAISVGIGTGAPAGQFHSYISATRYFGHNVNSGDLSVLSDNNSAPVFKVQGTGTADLVNILDNTSQVFTIKDGGNVGIGTTSPSADLHINDTDGAAIVYQGDKRGKMIGKTIQRHTASSPKTDLFTINSFQSSNSNLYAVVTVLYVSPTSTNGGKMSAQFWIDNDNQSSPTVGSFSHEQQVGGGSFALEWDNTNKILKFVPDGSNYWYYVVDVEYVAFDGASVTFNTGASFNET